MLFTQGTGHNLLNTGIELFKFRLENKTAMTRKALEKKAECSLLYARNTETTEQVDMPTGCHIVSTLAVLIICDNNIMSIHKVKAEGLKESTQHT